jgi:hypothetical protein
MEERIQAVSGKVNLAGFDILHDSPLYKRRNPRKFEELVAAMEEQPELDREDVLKLNQIQKRFTAQEIEAFVEQHMKDDVFSSADLVVKDDETFEKLILAYDQSMRKSSKFEVRVATERLSSGKYSYPELLFIRKTKETVSEREA